MALRDQRFRRGDETGREQADHRRRRSPTCAGVPSPRRAFLHIRCEEDAQQAREGCLRDEPQWKALLYVAPIDLEASVSSN
jgi:hypothetical protein